MISYQNIYGQLLMVLSGATESQYICINKALACPFFANYIGVVALSSHTKLGHSEAPPICVWGKNGGCEASLRRSATSALPKKVVSTVESL